MRGRLFDAAGMFSPHAAGAEETLGHAAVKGAGATILSGAIGLAIQMVATVTLGRLLSPSDFGVVAMVLTFSYLLANGPANGFIDSILQRKEVTHALASTLFWLNLAIVVLLTAAFCACGPLLVRFYGEPRVARVAIGMSATILFTGLPIIHSALLRKAMRFTELAKNDIVSRAVGVLASIAFAVAGWSYWALVMGACAQALSTGIGVLILCPWIPGRPHKWTGVAATSKFATHITGRYTFSYFARNSDNLLVGWRFGAHALGFYKKAYDLFALSASQLVASTSNVAVSALSRVRDDREQYVAYLIEAISVMSFIGMGLAGDLTLIGRDLIRLLLGAKWGATGTLFTYFAPGIGVMIVYYIHGWIHVSIGRADRWLLWGIFEWIVTFSLFLVGMHWGPEGIAVAWCVSYWLLTIPAMAYAGKPIDFGAGALISAVWRYALASLTSGVAVFALVARVAWLHAIRGPGGAAVRIGFVSVLFMLLYLGMIVVLHGGTAPLRNIARLARKFRSRKQAVVAVEVETL